MKLAGKNVLVTGGSAGLVSVNETIANCQGCRVCKEVCRGRCFPLSIFLTTAGCNVAINYANSADRANKFVKELESTYPKLKFAVIQADVGQKSACEKLIAETISHLGGLDVIISNAGKLKHELV